MSKPIVAVIGRPNVGKSTFFNKIAGSRVSIVEDTPGVTRDRIYHDIEWNGRTAVLVDTGGIEPQNNTAILKHIRMQAELAVETADVIIFMTDVNAGLTADDRDIFKRLQRSRKPVVVAVNKVDRVGTLPYEFYEFYELGSQYDPIPVSSLHGTGSGDVLDLVFSLLPEDDEPEADDDHIRVAVIGKPNAGKSSLVNQILGENRMIVSDMAGTTRDAIDSDVENDFGKYTFVDTAGIRRRSKVEDSVERFSVLRAKTAVERADVCLIMIDATQGVTEQDEKVAGLAHEAGKASIICINKWDLVEKDNSTVKQFTDDVRTALAFMPYAPIMFISAQTGQRVDKLFPLINEVYNQACTRISTGMLNDILNDATTRVQPPSDKGRRLKIYYMTQTGVKPPSFVIFCSDPELFHFSYRRYLENRLREVFGFSGTPIRMTIRGRGDNDD